jgi:hypothetical protein
MRLDYWTGLQITVQITGLLEITESNSSGVHCKSRAAVAEGTVQEPKGRGNSTTGSWHQRTGEETADHEVSARALVNCNV